ncbi:unnamed protein product, partial [Ectocarpus sp. 13 AM-2016]
LTLDALISKVWNRFPAGDFRMYFGENPDKVKNIVRGTLGRFQELYAPALKVKKGLH